MQWRNQPLTMADTHRLVNNLFRQICIERITKIKNHYYEKEQNNFLEHYHSNFSV